MGDTGGRPRTPGKRVDFFIVGVQKGGTTALHRKLGGHPSIALSRTKELHFFDRENVDWENPPYGMLESHFDFSAPAVFGEATPIYMYWPGAIERISRYNPEAKIIVILRHPAFRALSAWKMEVARHAESLPFLLAVSGPGRRRVRRAPGGVQRIYSYVERGHYAEQIGNILRVFPRRQVLFLTSDELWENEARTLNRIFRFLGLPPGDTASGNSGPRYVVPLDTRHMPARHGLALAYLKRRFRPEISRTAEIAELDLGHWLARDYEEPMRGS